MPFCIEFENNMMSQYIEGVHAIQWCTKTIYIPYIMDLVIIQLHMQSPPISDRFLVFDPNPCFMLEIA